MEPQPIPDSLREPTNGVIGQTERRLAAAALAAQVLDARDRGEVLPDQQVVAAHPDLLPELLEELGSARRVRMAYVAAQMAGEIHAPIEVLGGDELEAPIEFSKGTWGTELPLRDTARPVLAGYGLIREISRGGQGTVYEAVQESTGRTVAVKVVAGGVMTESRHRARFDREVEVLAALKHPNVVNILDRGRAADGSFCLVMEYVDGRELDEYWDARLPAGSKRSELLCELFAKIARAVDEAHQRGIVHRDIKPSNIRVDARGEPHVLDFGLARTFDASSRAVTVSRQIVGSLPWASPEQVAGDSAALDARSDVYSLGVMLFQGLTGRFPYPTDGDFRSLINHIATSPVPPLAAVGGSARLRRALDSVLLKAMAKRPADRYASAGALADDLERALVGRRIEASPRRRWTRRFLIGLGIVAAMSISALFSWHGMHAPVIPTVYELPAVTNSVGMRLVRIEPGTFMMGSPATGESTDSTYGAHRVTLQAAYFISTTEVTQQQYEAVMDANPSDIRWRAPNLPVQRVTWNEAVQFCRKLTEREHRTYRLPTEAEWEYACRMGPRDPVADDAELEAVAWYAANSGGSIHAVAGKRPNAWGLHDMQGNVAEWCADNFPSADPARRARLRVVKGGSMADVPVTCRPTSHQAFEPEFRNSDIGFRVVLDPETPSSRSAN